MWTFCGSDTNSEDADMLMIPLEEICHHHVVPLLWIMFHTVAPPWKQASVSD